MCRHASPDVIHASQHAALQRALTLCTHAHRRACVTRFVLACSSTCMRAQGPWSFAPCRSTRTRETCAFAERCDGFRPQRPGSHHGRAGFQNNVQVSMSDLHVSMSRFCPGVRQAALGRAEAGEFGGNGVQAFKDIVIVGFLGRGLFGEE